MPDNLRQVIEEYKFTVYRLAYSLVKDPYDADDIYQEVFLKYLKKKPVFHSKEHEKAWFMRVTVNACKNFWKSAWQSRVEGIGEQDFSAYQPQEESEGLIETVKMLPEKYRVVIHLFYYEELSVEEIGHVLKRKPSTVRTQLTRARSLLKEILKEDV